MNTRPNMITPTSLSQKSRVHRLAILVLSGLLATWGAADAWADEAPSGAVTYAGNIAAILDKNCVQCHREGESAPFTFENYDQAKRRAKLIAEVTQSRTMPPWKAVRGHQKYANERGLNDSEIASLQEWAAQGAPEGDPSIRPAPPVFPKGWQLGEPDAIVRMPQPFTVPAEGPDIYWHFVIDLPPSAHGKWIRGIEYRTHAPLVAHHTLFMLDNTGDARKADAETPESGFEEMSNPAQMLLQGGSPYFDTWAIGNRAEFYPHGTGVPITPGMDLVLQCHFHPSGKEVSEQAELGLYLTDQPPATVLDNVPVPYGFGFGIGLDVPPGSTDYEISDSFTLPVSGKVFSIMPHAHYICKEMTCVAELPGGDTLTLVEIKDWDFSWQEKYELAEPISLPKGTVIRNTFKYDNSTANPNNPFNPPRRITFGPNSTDEMASIALRVMLDSKEAAEELHAGLRVYARQTIANANIDMLWEGIKPRLIARYDTDGDKQLNMTEKIKAMAVLRERYSAADSEGGETLKGLTPEDREIAMRLAAEFLKHFMAM